MLLGTESLGLARGKGLPEGCAPDLGVLTGPVHEIGCPLVRTKEQDLGLSKLVHDFLQKRINTWYIFDAWSRTNNQQVKNGINILLKGNHGLVLLVDIQQDGSL